MLKPLFVLAVLLPVISSAEPEKAPAPATTPTPKPLTAPALEPVTKLTEDGEEKAAEDGEKKEAPKLKLVEPPAPEEEASKPEPKEDEEDPEVKAAKKERDRLALFNSLASERQNKEFLEKREKIAEMKLESEFLNTQIALEKAKIAAQNAEMEAKFEAEEAALTREATLAKLRADQLNQELKQLQAESSLKTTALMSEISVIETKEKREVYANSEPQYLDDPLQEDGSLIISDRRIPFNGPVTSRLADTVTERINFFNNKDPKKPIFIVIDDSPGGSVMAGYRILKAMEGSEAPVFVVVKSFAASMAASITTLAERSFVYPNAIILHHQISQTFMFSRLNLTEQKENVDDLKKWWDRLAGPIAEKMGITAEEFIEQMYENTVSGDWTEFGDDAVKIKWADHVVTRIHETSLVKNPDSKKEASKKSPHGTDENGLIQAIDDKGRPYMILPRKNPKDIYMMHNPDGYYRFQ